MKQNNKVLSLFCGCGGFDIGFDEAGFETIWANDFNKDACNTFEKYFPKTQVVHGDIAKVDFDEIPDGNVILGGFPCQGFSLAGPRKIDDSRNSLYKHFVKLVDKQQPDAFVAENVKGILTIGNSDEIIHAILDDFSSKGYDISLTLVNAADYDVPEDRMRTIIVGIRKDLNKRFYMPKPLPNKKTIGDVLTPDDVANPADVTQTAYSSRYMSRNRKRNWNQQSFTIPASAKQVALWPGSPDMIKIDSEHWVFGDNDLPDDQRTTRRLSYKEAAAIQTFPSDMEFCGNLESKYRQIGNAVPPRLAYAVAKRLKDILEGEWSPDTSDDCIEPTLKTWN